MRGDAAAAVRAFKARGWLVFGVANEPGIAHGASSEADVALNEALLAQKLAREGAEVNRFYHCPFDPEGTVVSYRRDSFDRMPRPGMLIRAMTEFQVVKERSLLIGSIDAEIEAARAAGIAGFLFGGGELASFAEWALADLEDGR